jgi:hypothetical protein
MKKMVEGQTGTKRPTVPSPTNANPNPRNSGRQAPVSFEAEDRSGAIGLIVPVPTCRRV